MAPQSPRIDRAMGWLTGAASRFWSAQCGKGFPAQFRGNGPREPFEDIEASLLGGAGDGEHAFDEPTASFAACTEGAFAPQHGFAYRPLGFVVGWGAGGGALAASMKNCSRKCRSKRQKVIFAVSKPTEESR